jgi:hypothetical protein
MTVDFITLQAGIITGQHCGDFDADFSGTFYHGHERMAIPPKIMVRNGDSINFYYEDWNRKTDMQLIEEGLLPTPEGFVREGDELRPMTAEERVIAGLDDPQPGCKVEGGQIVAMTLLERLGAGQITQDEYNEHTASGNKFELNRLLAELQTPEALAQAEVDEDYAIVRRAKLAALLAVKQQSGWPVTAEWPE